MKSVHWKLGVAAVACAILLTSPAFAQRVTDGLVGYWRFEETGGTTVADETGTLNATVVSNPNTPDLNVAGRHGSGVRFPAEVVDGQAGYIWVDAHPSLDITQAVTIEFWTQVPQDFPTIANWTTLNTWISHGNETFMLRTHRGGTPQLSTYRIRFDIRNATDTGGTNQTLNSDAGRPLVPGEWTHVVAVFDANGPEPQARFYFDGVLNGTLVRTNPIASFPAEGLAIGASFAHFNQTPPEDRPFSNFLGPVLMDEVAIYNRALSDAEVMQNFQADPAAEGEGEGEGEDITTGLVAHWKFEETSGTTVADSSGNGHTLTLKTVGSTSLPDLNVPGRLGSAISFPPNAVGTAGYAEADNHPDFDITGSITLSAWVKIPDPWAAVGNNAHVLGKSDDTWQLRRESSSTQNRMKVSIRDRTITPTNDVEAQSTSQLVPGGEWTHLVGVYDETAGQVRFYFNGVLEHTAARTGPIAVNSHGVQVGANLSADGTELRRNFGGLVDEVRIYNRALSAAEVTALFQDTGEGGEGGEGEGEGEPQGNVITSNVYPPFIDEGTTVILTAPQGTDYQWRKDGLNISGETDRELVFDSVTLLDAGVYTVRYDDGTKAVVVSRPFNLLVQPEGSVPVAGLLGLAGLIGACGLGGAAALRRRRR